MSSAAVLQRVGLQLVHQPDPPALVPAHVEDDPAALGRDRSRAACELGAAVAAQRAEDVAGEALGVDADEDVLAVAEVAVTKATCSTPSSSAPVADGRGSRRSRVGTVASATRSTVRSVRRRYAIRSAMEIIGSPCSSANSRSAGARIIVPSSWTISQIDPGRAQAGQPGEVDGGLGVADPPQHPALHRPQREHVAGTAQLVRLGRAVGEHPDRCAPGPLRRSRW